MGKQALQRLWWVPFGKVPEVEASELNEALRSDSPPQILDVRTRREYKNGHIEGSIHVPITELRSRVDQLPFDRRKRVVTICLTAHRSIPALRVLKAHGFEDVLQLAGGMVDWRRKRLPTRSE
ncbi:MAG: rhodanese-like domain-containing protein [Desulfobacteraceae bacterium]|nr:MAG: rhodanese-like domain-containing protein [Desulfobacteraceae bacterium]